MATKKTKTQSNSSGRRSTSTKKTSGKSAVGAKNVKTKASATRTAAVKTTRVAKKSATSKKASSSTATRRTKVDANELIHGIKPDRAKRKERYMNRQQQVHFEKILRSWRLELVDDLERTVSSMQNELLTLPDPNDRASQETDRTLELRTRDRERKLIHKIDESLALISSSDYGYCENCGIEIGVRRLEARPTATQCIDCKNLNELREKQGY